MIEPTKKERVVVEFTSGFFIGIVIAILIVIFYLNPKNKMERLKYFKDGKDVGRSASIIYLNKHYSKNDWTRDPKINFREILLTEDSLTKWKLKIN